MRFLMSPNPTYPIAMETAAQIEGYLRRSGHECFRFSSAENCPEADMAIVIGGDGTIIRAVREMHTLNIPFWSVNCGNLGYLAECEPDEVYDSLERILKGDYRTERRSLLEGSLLSGLEETPFFALNEAVAHRASFSRTLQISIAVDGNLITTLAGDGMIIATATGSTAYNLSAGGPVLLPEAKSLAITPICAHSAICSPIVIPDGHEVSLTVRVSGQDEENGRPLLVVDGMKRIGLNSGDRITCRSSREQVEFVRTGSINFYQRLQAKL